MRTRTCLLMALSVGVVVTTPVAAFARASAAAARFQEDPKAELEQKKAEVDDKDPAAMFELAQWAESKGLKTDAKRLLRKVIKLDKNHKEARESLGYVWFEERWVTQREKERLERKSEEEAMLAKGLRKWRGEWVPLEDYEMYERGLVPYEADGQRQWVTPIEKERREKGMIVYHGMWILPEEQENVDKGLFKVGEEWVDKAKANEMRTDSSNPWEFEHDLVKFRTTCDYDFSQIAMQHADKAVEQAYQILDLTRTDEYVKNDLIMVMKTEDYQQLGQNVQDNNDALMSSVYETFCVQDPNSGRFNGVALYTTVDESNKSNNDNMSRLILRHAAAESAIRNAGFTEQIPRWFQCGVGTYCSRFWDPFVADGIEKLGGWSVGALHREGGMVKMKSYFDAFSISRQTILQSGLLVSFLMHGKLPKKVESQWGKVREALKGEDAEVVAKEFVRLEIQLASKQAEEALESYADQLLRS